MAAKLKIEIGGVSLNAGLYEGASVQAFIKGLPLDVRMSRWGDEYYGNCGLDLPDDPGERDLMQVGELAFWAPGRAFCIFFGRTPASTDDRPRAASGVIPLGRIEGDVSALKTLGDSVRVRLSLG
jgi:hypothetical protein